MGIAAFNLLLEEMVARKEETEFIPKTVELDTEIIERESSVKN
jgi:LacI family transcriptional regulator